MPLHHAVVMVIVAIMEVVNVMQDILELLAHVCTSFPLTLISKCMRFLISLKGASTTCSGNGNCNNDGSCLCNSGYFGSDCSCMS